MHSQNGSTRKRNEHSKLLLRHITTVPVQNAPGGRGAIKIVCVRFVYVISHERPEIDTTSKEFKAQAIANHIA